MRKQTIAQFKDIVGYDNFILKTVILIQCDTMWNVCFSIKYHYNKNK